MATERPKNLSRRNVAVFKEEGIGRVQKPFIEGDVHSGIVLELALDDDNIDSYTTQVLLKGGRVFGTKAGKTLIIHSKESLSLKKNNIWDKIIEPDFL